MDPTELLDTTVIVVSYNTRELTLACLESIFEATHSISFEVIVVDNASSDGSAESIRRSFPEVQLLALDQNLGFGAANNLAAGRARGKQLVLLNPDTRVLDRAIECIVAFGQANPQSGIVGGRTLALDGSLNPSSCWAAPTLWSVFCHASMLTSLFPGTLWFDPTTMGRWPRDTERDVDIISGCFLSISRDLWNRLGGFDDRFFMYGEDADLSLRAAALGYQPRITPEASVVHVGAASEPVKQDKLVRLIRAQRQVLRIHWTPARAAIGLAVNTSGAALRALAALLLDALGVRSRFRGVRAWRAVWKRRSEWR